MHDDHALNNGSFVFDKKWTHLNSKSYVQSNIKTILNYAVLLSEYKYFSSNKFNRFEWKIIDNYKTFYIYFSKNCILCWSRRDLCTPTVQRYQSYLNIMTVNSFYTTCRMKQFQQSVLLYIYENSRLSGVVSRFSSLKLQIHFSKKKMYRLLIFTFLFELFCSNAVTMIQESGTHR